MRSVPQRGRPHRRVCRTAGVTERRHGRGDRPGDRRAPAGRLRRLRPLPPRSLASASRLPPRAQGRTSQRRLVVGPCRGSRAWSTLSRWVGVRRSSHYELLNLGGRVMYAVVAAASCAGPPIDVPGRRFAVVAGSALPVGPRHAMSTGVFASSKAEALCGADVHGWLIFDETEFAPRHPASCQRCSQLVVRASRRPSLAGVR